MLPSVCLIHNEGNKELPSVCLIHNENKMSPQIEALGNFLDVIDFTHFCTFTTRKPISLNSTRRIAEKVAKFVNAGDRSTMFWAAEKFDVREGFHFHALLQSDFSPIEIFNWYFPRYGRCQIIDNAAQERRQSASYYCAKYVTKSVSDYDIYFSKRIKNRSQLDLYRKLNEFDRFV